MPRSAQARHLGGRVEAARCPLDCLVFCPQLAAAQVLALFLASDRSQVLVQVWDGSPDPPVQASTDENAESGRGLLLVEALCADWGWHLPAGGSKGKWVWGAVALAGGG